MPSQLPSESAQSKSVPDFGLGPYDSSSVGDSEQGENDDGIGEDGESLPDNGGKEVFGPDRLLGYPIDPSAKSASNRGSELPSDSDNPSARSDYYDQDHLKVGDSRHDIWPDEDSGAYAQSELPGVAKNESTMDDFLGVLGNAYSGYTIEDVSNVDTRTVSSKRRPVMSNQNPQSPASRVATNTELVGTLTVSFLKEYGKKNLTRRHVMAFLQSQGRAQYLASDIIRCLKHRHKIVIADVLDEFPIRKVASESVPTLASVHRTLVGLEITHVREPLVASAIRGCAADLADVIASLDRFRRANG